MSFFNTPNRLRWERAVNAEERRRRGLRLVRRGVRWGVCRGVGRGVGRGVAPVTDSQSVDLTDPGFIFFNQLKIVVLLFIYVYRTCSAIYSYTVVYPYNPATRAG